MFCPLRAQRCAGACQHCTQPPSAWAAVAECSTVSCSMALHILLGVVSCYGHLTTQLQHSLCWGPHRGTVFSGTHPL